MNDRRTQRLDRISDALDSFGSLRLADAASLLEVSEMTVRRDVAAHPERFSCYGGHIIGAQGNGSGTGYVLDRERESHSSNKKIACERAVGFLEPGDTVFIDCGTTTPHLARRLADAKDLTVVCYSLNIADVVRRFEQIKLVLLGGVYHRSSASFDSPEALEHFRRIGINKAFLSAGGVHPAHGVSCSNFHEVGFKQEAMRKALATYLVVDSSKFGKVRSAYFADVDAFDAIVTDAVDFETRRLFEDRGIRLVTP
ncbi:DeoR/GlpR transcriptional regulator [Siculibacillus lacustris]|uniref:DeoR/GlpR transcriptional regulator n=1 Tax=Siculibacillus lacustris TaxID=1549641 RepID=A0A4Q9VY03_9HYPH|nr:DeoR/GlpR family DNA-binding transcription regulator [Siculibacillus lacustris]TBW41396.1 DeoR/GlpR transcriptional regulator [Siculibacillus lacustris]